MRGGGRLPCIYSIISFKHSCDAARLCAEPLCHNSRCNSSLSFLVLGPPEVTLVSSLGLRASHFRCKLVQQSTHAHKLSARPFP